MVKEKIEQINPFVINNRLQFRRVQSTSYVPNNNGVENAGYVHSGSVIKNTYLVDAHKKVNLFVPTVKLMDDLIFEKMSSGARTLFLYIMVHLQHNQDYIKLGYKTLTTTCKMSRATVTRCLRELIDLSIIVIKSQSVYWVNPMYLFNGSRLNYYGEIKPEVIEEV